jgi:hypothetical protein
LILTYNGIIDEGAQHLANALQHKKVRKLPSNLFLMHLSNSIQTLTTLTLTRNRITDEGAQHLSNALQQSTVKLVLHSSISYVSVLINAGVHYYIIDIREARYLANALQHNTVRLAPYSSILCESV